MTARRHRDGTISRIAAVALLPAGAFAVHQLRYWLAFGSRAGIELQQQGHSYLHSLVPWVVLLIAVALGSFLRALGRAMGGDRPLPRYTLSFVALWLLCAACLLVIYISQELLEGLFATGHPPGLAGVFGYGGWWSIPAALAVGLVLATVFCGARRVLHEVARRAGDMRVPAIAPEAACPRDMVLMPRLAPMAGGWSGRGPPL